MDLLVEKLDGSRYYLSQYKVLITEFEESAPSVTRNNMQLDQHNGNIDFGGWHTDKTINITGYYRADDMDEEEVLREKLYALLSDPAGYYITQLKTTPSVAMERPGETSGGYYEKLIDYPSHKRFLVYTEAPEMELVGNVNGTLLYKLTAEFKTIKLPYGESLPQDLDFKSNVPYIGRNLLVGTSRDLQTAPDSPDGISGGTIHTFSSDDLSILESSQVTLRAFIHNTTTHTVNLVIWTEGGGFGVGTGVPAGADGYSTITAYNATSSASRGDITIRAYTENTTISGVQYKEFKLEKGFTATPYSPAPEDPGYNEWYLDTYYNANNLFIPYAGSVPCNQLEQGFAIEMTAKGASSSLSFKIDDTELTYSGAVASGDVFTFNGFSYTKNGLSIVSKTNKAYFILQPDKPNRITCNVPGTVRILGLQNLYA